jgi:hypothetical protein
MNHGTHPVVALLFINLLTSTGRGLRDRTTHSGTCLLSDSLSCSLLPSLTDQLFSIMDILTRVCNLLSPNPPQPPQGTSQPGAPVLPPPGKLEFLKLRRQSLDHCGRKIRTELTGFPARVVLSWKPTAHSRTSFVS